MYKNYEQDLSTMANESHKYVAFLPRHCQKPNSVKYLKENSRLPPSLNIDEAVIEPTYFAYDSVPSMVMRLLLRPYTFLPQAF